MDINKNKGRIVGALILVVIIAGGVGLNFRGLSSSLIGQEDFLQTVFNQSFEMKISIVFNLIAGGIWVFISIWLYPFLSVYRKSLALSFVGIWLISFSVSLHGDMSHLALIELSENFINDGANNRTLYESLATMKVRDYFSAHFFGLIAYATAAFCFFYLLFLERLVPRFLSVWGMIAMSIIFFATWTQIFGYKVSFYFYGQNGLHLITFTLWLVVKGFSQPQTRAVS